MADKKPAAPKSGAPAPKTVMPNYVKFIVGGLSGMSASVFVQPLDLIKNRMQMSGVAMGKGSVSSLSVIRGIIANEGILAFYNGLSAGLLRQATYTTARMGVFTAMIDAFTAEDGTPPGFMLKTVFGMFAGVCGAFIGTPAEVSLIRMTSDGRLPPAERRNYKSVFDAIFRIVKEEGVLTLWRGAVPTMGRAMLVNGAQLGTYSQSKQMLLNSGYFKDDILLHFGASMISGFVTCVVSMPVDIAKTRIQNMKMIEGKPEYSGMTDVLSKILRNEGFFALWKGFMPYYMRVGPHTVLTFIFLEQLNIAYYRFA